MKIAITGGKGGTGKSTVATALAVELAKNYKIMLVDADVECPDDHLLLSIKREKIKNIKTFLPLFNQEKCLKCGDCAGICKENALIFIRGKYPLLIPRRCIGCGACLLKCQNEAILENRQIIGGIYKGNPEFHSKITDQTSPNSQQRATISENLILISGEMNVGCESSSHIVNVMCDFVYTLEESYSFVLIDTAAGTHCNVITALLDADLALAVAEPTPLGTHDLELILRLLDIFRIKSRIIVNKSDIGDLKLIVEVAKKHNITVISEIPYTKEIIKNYSEGIPIRNDKISKIVAFLEHI